MAKQKETTNLQLIVEEITGELNQTVKKPKHFEASTRVLGVYVIYCGFPTFSFMRLIVFFSEWEDRGKGQW